MTPITAPQAQNSSKKLITVIALFSVISLFAAIVSWQNWLSVRDSQQLHQQNYLLVVEKMSLYDSLQTISGYNGFLTSFNRYITSKDPLLFTRLESEKTRILKTLKQFHDLPLDVQERTLLRQLSTALQQYFYTLAIMHENADTQPPPSEQLQINEQPVIHNLHKLHSILMHQFTQIEDHIAYNGDAMHQFGLALLATLLLLLVFGSMAIYITVRMHANYQQTTMQTVMMAEAEARYRGIVANAVDAIVTISDKGIIEEANSATAKMFGYELFELIGRNISQLMPSDVAMKHDGYLDKYLQHGEKQIIGIGRNVTARKKNGQHFLVALAVSESRVNNIVRFTGIMRDLTKQVEYERELDKQRSLFQSSFNYAPVPMVVADIHRIIIKVNPATEVLFGYPSQRIIGVSMGYFYANQEDFASRLEQTGSATFQEPYIVKYKTASGREFHGETIGTTLYDNAGKVHAYLCVIRDIDSQLAAQKEMQAAKEMAESANITKTQFLSNMSHELRTPMNSILGFSQLLQHEAHDNLTEEQLSYIDHVLDSGNHLLKLINDILDLAKIEAGKLQVDIEPYHPVPLINESIIQVQPFAQNSGITINNSCEVADLPMLRVDATRFKQVFINLLTNAIKYNRPQGTVDIKCELRENSLVRISVTDTGYGIPESRQQELFVPFSRLDAAAGVVEGTGIGLAVSKELVDLMHGHIGLNSVVDQGTTFWFEVPTATEQTTEPTVITPGTEQQQHDISGVVLYIEDTSSNLLLMQALINAYSNVTLFAASTGAEGIALAQQELPDLILLDINLPDMDGLEVLRQLRDNPLTTSTPVIAISANAMSVAIEQAMQAGCYDYITKPINVKKMMALLQNLLSADD